MTTHCQNCHSAISGNFCSHCGQNTDTHRLNAHFLWHDIQHGLLHVDKGFLYTTKELFIRPGHSIREFLSGKRVNHFKPISFILILAGFYSLLSHYFDINFLANSIQVTGNNEKSNQARKVIEWASQHYSLVALLQIPFFSVGTYLSFKKIRYNFIEHLVINTFIAGQKLIVHIVAFPFYYFFNKTPYFNATANLTDLIGYVIPFWTLFQLFNELSFLQRIWRTLLSLFITFVIVYVLLTLISQLL